MTNYEMQLWGMFFMGMSASALLLIAVQIGVIVFKRSHTGKRKRGKD